MTSVMEELEIKEPTPSLAPSQYESPLYTKKWRLILAVLIGVTLIGVCILGFYLSVKSREGERMAAEINAFNASTAPPPRSSNIRWRNDPNLCLSLTNDTCPEGYVVPPLLVIGVNGLRPDLLNDDKTPAMNYLTRCGVSAESLVPTYPTATFPNMYSIATGLYPESHGIIGNEMYDPRTNKTFKYNERKSRTAPAWWQGEPIWNTVTKQGKKSATYFWAGSDVLIQERYPIYWQKYRNNETFEIRVRQVIDWLMMPEEERPHLIMVYFEQPMLTFQQYGPNSQEATNALEMVDRILDGMLFKLHQAGLAHCINILLVSDHGAAPASCTSSFYLETFISDIEQKAHVYAGAVGRLRAVSGGDAAEKEILETLSCKNPRVRALPKKLLPRRYHYTNNPRIESVILDTMPNTRVVTNTQNYCRNGEHGFNNLEASMQATFIGFGPSLKVNYTSKSFRNVELYNLMCKLMNITPAKNNGTAGSLDHFLRHVPHVAPPAMLADLLPEVKKGLPEKLPRENKEPEAGENGAKEKQCSCFIEKTETIIPTESIPSNSSNPSSSNSTSNVNSTEPTPTSSTTSNPNSSKKNKTQAELSHMFNIHVPWGSPGYSAPDITEGELKVLLHSSYVIGLHETLNLGVWVSFTLNNQTIALTEKEKPSIPAGIEIKPEDVRVVDEKPPPCWEADLRLDRLPEDQCHRMLSTEAYHANNITLIQLFPEGMETDELLIYEGHLLSNIAPVKSGYRDGAHTIMVNALRNWTTTMGVLNVVHGPVFDYNLDGHQDQVSTVLNTIKPLVPSDYYFVVTLCSNTSTGSCSSDPVDVLAFVFPNTEVPDNCLMSDMEYLQYHLTTVRDVELLTGSRFFRSKYVRDGLKYRTYQPISIWPLPSPEHSTGHRLTQRIGKTEDFE